MRSTSDPLPVYGDGRQVRNWLYMEDFARAIDLVLREGGAGEVYNVGGPDEEENLHVVERILELTGRDPSLIEHVEDRKGHDRRYSLASDKVRALGWEPRVELRGGLERTVEWYRENEWWWGPVRSGEYREYYERQYGPASWRMTRRALRTALAHEALRRRHAGARELRPGNPGRARSSGCWDRTARARPPRSARSAT